MNEEQIQNLEAITTVNPDSEAMMQMICTAADEQKARDIVVLDVQHQTIVADYFIVCSGTSTTHIQSIAGGVQDRLRERARLRAKAEGDAGSFWVILDYGDVILHVFDAPTREFYDLERLWDEAPAIPWTPQDAVGVTTAQATAQTGPDTDG